jgi:hypothetical protein
VTWRKDNVKDRTPMDLPTGLETATQLQMMVDELDLARLLE